jgi:murein DD-endopeptidase MepM/ murein hydrolase activator NlpD
MKEKHFGIDVVAPKNEAIKATLDGTVIFAEWTIETGYVIQLQHADNIVSIYKHNSILHKEVGDYVKAGEVIAIVGNSGELSTGPHLHFELWYNGIPINQFLDNKTLDESRYERGKNEFAFTLPTSKVAITFRLFTHKEEKAIERELEGLKKLKPMDSPEVTTRFKYMITSINGNREAGEIREFVDTYLLAKDARALRKEYSSIQPDLNLIFNFVNDEGREEEVPLPIGLDFFWPDAV